MLHSAQVRIPGTVYLECLVYLPSGLDLNLFSLVLSGS